MLNGTVPSKSLYSKNLQIERESREERNLPQSSAHIACGSAERGGCSQSIVLNVLRPEAARPRGLATHNVVRFVMLPNTSGTVPPRRLSFSSSTRSWFRFPTSLDSTPPSELNDAAKNNRLESCQMLLGIVPSSWLALRFL